MIREAFAKLIDALTDSVRKSTQEGGILRVRGIMALTVTGVASVMALKGDLEAEVFASAWIGILGIYFGARLTQVANDRANGNKS